jgi:Zc3h12a-like Ribonuclease NYN domain/S1 RNA binding domain
MKIKHVIVDGSNIATEGRDAPSLAQLDEAVQAFVEEYSPTHVTVVVDATFPNRIDRKERQTYEDAVNANELITPPAGAIGRGDAFVLQIARRAGAAILSNDSFQEFHGEYPWLFERGRLFGGKPVPHVGWVFMERAPVRGPTSRRAVSEARKVAKAAEKVAQPAAEVAQEAAEMAEPDGAAPAEKPGRRRRTRAAVAKAPAVAVPASEAVVAVAAEPDGAADKSGRAVDPYNDAMAFIEFVGRHPVGSEVDATIERFSSHGAYVLVGEARAYVPLRNLADPAPRSAKGILKVGETRRFVVVSIDPPRRGIDLGVPDVVEIPAAAPAAAEDDILAVDTTDASAVEEAPAPAPARKSRARKATAKEVEPAEPPARKSRARKATAKEVEPAEPPARKSRARKATAKAAARVTPAPAAEPKVDAAAEPPARRSRARKATANAEAKAPPAPAPEPEADAAAGPAPRKSRARKPTAKATPAPAASPAGAEPAPRKSRARKATAKAAAEPPVRKAAARKAAPSRRRGVGGGTGDDVVVALAAEAGKSAPQGEAAGA